MAQQNRDNLTPIQKARTDWTHAAPARPVEMRRDDTPTIFASLAGLWFHAGSPVSWLDIQWAGGEREAKVGPNVACPQHSRPPPTHKAGLVCRESWRRQGSPPDVPPP
ncbi:hypothetical protein MAPG_00071 [Magnaporthiopsis poae ATCC 64411]|uniref:Uncharacterized protein n=1 Tax=Magnaporthiopsis poae (strain ATCC 64411 / 73-15) TaxID=644358 RepID=A0A0C4DK09_MAGP6|nr:hypothetical protein MAPG_00071 [Magnaporthiopsis poae ATCC 64411]